MKIKYLHGNCLELLKTIESESVQCCITSPPYYGLRNYGNPPVIFRGEKDCLHEWKDDGRCTKCDAWKGQLGLEPNPYMYIDHLTDIFAEAYRVMRKDGTLWINIADSYADRSNTKTRFDGHGGEIDIEQGRAGYCDSIIKPKSLIGIPWRLAFALQEKGFYLRQDIIWHKKNGMPEPVQDRCTKAHEYIFLLSKSGKYYFDRKAIEDTPYKKSVWAVNLVASSNKHIAPYPYKLAEACVLASTKIGDTVLDPFAGSCITAKVATDYQRKAIAIEQNDLYIKEGKKNNHSLFTL